MSKIIYKLFHSSLFELSFQFKKRLQWIFKKNSYGTFGKFSVFEKPLIIYNKKNIFIGSEVIIRPNLRIEPIKKYGSQTFDPKIVIGNNTSIEQNCHITCANKVSIGDNVTIAGYSMITDIDHEYRDISKNILKQPLIVKETVIGDTSFIGMGARIMPGVHIGKHCIIGSNSVVTTDIPDYSVAIGIPAKVIKRYDFDKEDWIKV